MTSEELFKKSLEDLLASKEFSFDEANWEDAQRLMDGEAGFKGILEESLNSKVFPFDESNWAKARKLITASKGRNKRVPFVLSILLLLLSIATGIYFIAYTPFDNDITLASTPKKEMPLPVSSHVSTTDKIKVPALIKKQIQQPQTQSLSKDPSLPKTLTGAATPPESTSSKVNKKETPAKTQTIKQPVTPTTVAPIMTTTAKQQPAESKITSPVNGITEVAASSPPQAVTKKEMPNGSQHDDAADKDLIPVTNSPVKIAPIQTPETTPLSKEPIKSEAQANITSTVTGSAQEKAPTEEVPTSAKLNLSDTTTITPPMALVDSTKNNTPQLAEILGDNDQGELGKPKENPVLFSIEAGASYMFGWQNASSRDASGFNPVVGINYFHNFKPKMALTLGLQYSSVSNLSFSSYTSKITRLGLGEESKVTVFTPVKAHYLIVPLRFNYSINPLNTFGIGCNIAYLLTVESKVETYTERGNTKYDDQLSKTSGYTEGFKKYDAQVSVFYKRNLHRNLAINLEAFYGLTDIKENAFLGSTVFERNSGLKLTLVYNFLKK